MQRLKLQPGEVFHHSLDCKYAQLSQMAPLFSCIKLLNPEDLVRLFKWWQNTHKTKADYSLKNKELCHSEQQYKRKPSVTYVGICKDSVGWYYDLQCTIPVLAFGTNTNFKQLFFHDLFVTTKN